MTVKDEEEDEQQNSKKSRPSNSSETREGLIPTLLPEIILEILLRLPVESVLRCRSVCKAWLSLISDPKFVKSHLNLSVRGDDYAHHRLIYSSLPKISFKSCSLSKLLCDKSVDAVELDYPLKHPHKTVLIVGSCNGLICLNNWDEILYIWNPATRRSNRLPRSGVKLRTRRIFYGFGYLECNDDYKVVGIFCMFHNGGGYSTEVEVYSMKTGNWKRIGEFSHGVPINSSGKYLNGALHWAASQDFGSPYSWRIVSLDLAKETYDEVLQPVYGKTGFALSLGVLGDWLMVMCFYDKSHGDVWVMKEYGVKESCTKLVSIPYLPDPAGMYQYWVPLCISNDGKFLLQLGSQLFLYDPKDGHITEIQNMDVYLDADTYVESLVTPAALDRPWR